MACEHDAAEMDTAAHWDGLCPLCMNATIERLRAALQRVDALNDNPAHFNSEINEVVMQALQPSSHQ